MENVPINRSLKYESSHFRKALLSSPMLSVTLHSDVEVGDPNIISHGTILVGHSGHQPSHCHPLNQKAE